MNGTVVTIIELVVALPVVVDLGLDNRVVFFSVDSGIKW